MYALPGIAPSDRFADSSLKARRSILFLQRSVLSDTGGIARSAWPRIDQRDGMQRRGRIETGISTGLSETLETARPPVGVFHEKGGFSVLLNIK